MAINFANQKIVIISIIIVVSSLMVGTVAYHALHSATDAARSNFGGGASDNSDALQAIQGDNVSETTSSYAAQLKTVNDKVDSVSSNVTTIQTDIQTLKSELPQLIQEQVGSSVQTTSSTLQAQIGAIQQNLLKQNGGSSQSPYPLNQAQVSSAWVGQDNTSPVASGQQSQQNNQNLTGSLLNPNGTSSASSASSNNSQNSNVIPFYTIPENTLLLDVKSITGLIGRIPISGSVQDPYRFMVSLSANNLAAENVNIPDLAEARMMGIAEGDFNLNCVKGRIYSITFIFKDGRISTTDVGESGDLGDITDAWGNACVTGTFISNAPKFLATLGALSFGEGFANAFSQEQVTSYNNSSTGTTSSSLTGGALQYGLGAGAANSAQNIQNWFMQREANSFDAVVLPSNTTLGILISKQINIDYDPNARKVNYFQNVNNVTGTTPTTSNLD